MVLNDIIDQVSERPQSKATHFSSAYQVIPILRLPLNDLQWLPFKDDDDEGPKMKDIVFDCIKRTSDVMCVWDCCWLWIRTAEVTKDQYILLLVFTFCSSGSVNHCVWPLHWALHHTLYRGQCAVHECWPLRRRVRWNVSITHHTTVTILMMNFMNESHWLMKCIYQIGGLKNLFNPYSAMAMQCSHRFCKLK